VTTPAQQLPAAPVRRGLKAPVAGTAVGLAVLAAASDVDFRWREARLALEGVADWQIRVELLLWACAGAFAAWHILHDRTWLVRRFPRDVGACTQTLLLIAATAMLSSLRGGLGLSVVRALQLVVLAALIAIAARSLQHLAAGMVWWIMLRRAFVAVVATLTIASLLLPGLRFDVVTHTGFSRLTIFYTHPITTGAFFGLAAVLLAGSLLGTGDPWLSRPWRVVAATAAVGGFGLLVLATRARGPLLATGTALLVLVALSRDRRRRGVAVLVAGVIAAAAIGGAFDEQLSAAFIRGQSTGELLSLTGRTDLFRYAGTLVAEQPVLGHGYLAARSIFLDRFPWAGESHNAYVDLAISLGLLGFVLYGVLFLRVVQRLRVGRARGGSARQLAAEAWSVLSFLLVMGMVSESFAGAMSVDVIALAAVVLLADVVSLRPLDQPGPAPPATR
jgi:O-antigen ligase